MALLPKRTPGKLRLTHRQLRFQQHRLRSRTKFRAAERQLLARNSREVRRLIVTPSNLRPTLFLPFQKRNRLLVTSVTKLRQWPFQPVLKLALLSKVKIRTELPLPLTKTASKRFQYVQ